MANLYLILAISFEELHTRRASSGVALGMTYNWHNSEKRTLSLELDESDCFLHGKPTIKLFILLDLLGIYLFVVDVVVVRDK